MEEKRRVKSLRVPIFHKTRIEGCSALSHLIMTFTNDTMCATGSHPCDKTTSVFWDTCPVVEQSNGASKEKLGNNFGDENELPGCNCAPFSLAKELLPKYADLCSTTHVELYCFIDCCSGGLPRSLRYICRHALLKH